VDARHIYLIDDLLSYFINFALSHTLHSRARPIPTDLRAIGCHVRPRQGLADFSGKQHA
jgi:hypothetical protein